MTGSFTTTKFFSVLSSLLGLTGMTGGQLKHNQKRSKTMPDTINTEVVTGETDHMELTVKIPDSGTVVTVRVSGYEDPADALKALYLLGQPERIGAMAAAMDEGLDEYHNGL